MREQVVPCVKRAKVYFMTELNWTPCLQPSDVLIVQTDQVQRTREFFYLAYMPTFT